MRSLVRILPGPYISAMHLVIGLFVTDFVRKKTQLGYYGDNLNKDHVALSHKLYATVLESYLEPFKPLYIYHTANALNLVKSKILLFGDYLNRSSIYTHFNTLKKKKP